MNSTTKSLDKRSGERRAGDRRQAAQPVVGRERRVAERRAGGDRRD
jgi:hypothetical protein